MLTEIFNVICSFVDPNFKTIRISLDPQFDDIDYMGYHLYLCVANADPDPRIR